MSRPGRRGRAPLDGAVVDGRAIGNNFEHFGIRTGGGDDRLAGGSRRDDLNGEGGADRLFGGAGRDDLTGGTGRDTLMGGAGGDSLWGGAGADQFAFLRPGEGGDRIRDFNERPDEGDRIRIDASNFGGGLGPGGLGSSQFRIRADNQAQDANDRFIYRTTDDTLWFDRNGSADGGLFRLAQFSETSTVTHQDILLV